MFSSLLPLRSKESVIGGLRQEHWHFQKGAQQRGLSIPEVRFSEMNNGVETWSLIQLCPLDPSSLEVKTMMQSHCNVLRSTQLAVIKS